MAVVVGIAGGSGSGKSTLAGRIVERFEPGTAVRLPHDAYYHDLSHLAPPERASRNFDHPDALDTPLLLSHLDALLRGEAVTPPRYDFRTHTRHDPVTTLHPASVVVVDGVMVLAVPEVRRILDLGVFVHTDPGERLARRLSRDVDERGRSRKSVLAQWEASVLPMHERFVEPSRAHAELVIEHGGFDGGSVVEVVSRILRLLGGE